MVPLLFALSMFVSPVQVGNVVSAHDAVQGFAPVTIASSQDAWKNTEQATSWSADGITSEEIAVLNLVNQDRASQGLAPLTLAPDLAVVARMHSRDMYVRRYFDHYAPSPGPTTPMDRYIAYLGHRPKYAMVGENIYYRSMTDVPTGAADQAETAFMNSPAHRANILQAQFTKLGVGVFRSSDGQYWVTEMFLRDRP